MKKQKREGQRRKLKRQVAAKQRQAKRSERSNLMRKNEKGSVTVIVVVTVLFILMLLGTYLVTISSKRKAQLQETILLQQAYGGDMQNIYEKQLQKRNTANSEYTDILYIEASGNQKITGITLPNNYKVSVTVSLEDSADYNIFDYNLGAPKLGINTNKKLEFKAKESTSSETTTEVKEADITFGKKVTITNECNLSNSIVLLNGAKIIEDEPIIGPFSITMFNGFKGKIYSVAIYENDDLKYNLIPCYKTNTKKIGLYDSIGKKFYENSGTGTDFTAGPEI